MRAVLLALLLAPVAGAQVLAVEAHVVMPLDFARGTESNENISGFCSGDRVQATNTSITFTDRQEFTDCAMYSVTMVAPAGAGDFQITFDADRRIESPDQTVAPAEARQELRLTTGSDNVTLEVFRRTEGERPMTTRETPLFKAGPVIRLGWIFAEESGEGVLEINPGGGHAFSSTVTRALLHFPTVTLPTPADETINLPRDVHDHAVDVRIRLDDDAILDGLHGANGPIQPRMDGQVLVLDRATLDAHGRSYRLDLTITPAPTSIAPMHWVAPIAVPFVAAIAVVRSFQYYRGTRSIYRRTARFILAGAGLTLVYALALSIAAPLALGQQLRQVPLSTPATVSYLQWGVLLTVSITIAFMASRRHLLAVQDDLHRRERQQEELLRSNRELEHFASVASHDLQEPLRKVAGFTNLLAHDPNSADAKVYANYAHDGATRMQGMVQDLLRYSRLGQTSVERLSISMHEVVQTTLDDLDALIEEAGAAVTVKQLPRAEGAAGLLQQLMANLIGNAIKYRHPDRAPTITISGHRWPFENQYVVSDNGRGIPEGQEEKVFQLFRRVHDDQTGTGIGLAMCARIVTLHGGRIWVESDDTGSRFHFTIPRNT